MQNIKSGKAEIIYLLSKAIEKYNSETGQAIVQNTNRKNYESLAILLSEISNQLPTRSTEWGTEHFPEQISYTSKEYPHRKYDITGGQIKDAISGIVSNPRPFLVEACYVYLYGVGRKNFKQNPLDANLLETSDATQIFDANFADQANKAFIEQSVLLEKKALLHKATIKMLALLSTLLFIVALLLGLNLLQSKNNWLDIKKDMNLLPYLPTKAEIDSLDGIWLCYTGSPQARLSDPTRYHKVVPNVVDVSYKNGYFQFTRYGASFDHVGFMQFESPGIVSVYSSIKNNSGRTESPRHSLLSLNSGNKYLTAISASWNFDVGEKNTIIGIREIYLKLGQGGYIEEVINDVENASCQCKIIRWHQQSGQIKSYYLKNELLDTLHLSELKPLINEESILLGKPQSGIVIFKDSIRSASN